MYLLEKLASSSQVILYSVYEDISHWHSCVYVSEAGTKTPRKECYALYAEYQASWTDFSYHATGPYAEKICQ